MTFVIQVSSGLLQDGHIKKMGSAVWEFMWLLDKMTKIDSGGTGYVLGGKPIKLDDIATGYYKKNGDYVPGLGIHRLSVKRNIDKLERAKYIKRLRTPRGVVITIMKAKKRWAKKPVDNVGEVEKRVSDSAYGEYTKPHTRVYESAYSNKTIQKTEQLQDTSTDSSEQAREFVDKRNSLAGGLSSFLMRLQ